MIFTVSVDISGPHPKSISTTRMPLQSLLLTLYSVFTANEQKNSDDEVMEVWI